MNKKKSKQQLIRVGKGKEKSISSVDPKRSSLSFPQELWRCASHTFNRIMYLKFHTILPAIIQMPALVKAQIPLPLAPQEVRSGLHSLNIHVRSLQDTTCP
jgi:hypothetical protein